MQEKIDRINRIYKNFSGFTACPLRPMGDFGMKARKTLFTVSY